MIKSMTGFGRGECINFDRRFKVELKSVNHRFSDFTIKLPRFMNPFEEHIRQRLATCIKRGKVDVWIHFESFTTEDIKIRVNHVFADSYIKVLRELSNRYGLGEVPLPVALELLAKTPDIIVFDKYENALNHSKDEIWAGLSEAFEMALAQFDEMRATEGAALAKDINENYNNALALIANIRECVPCAVEEYAVKLRERINCLTDKLEGKPDDGRLLTEIALIADKTDISEEMARLESHLQQMAAVMREGNAVGRKMDFLLQELNREVNTIGSKSSDIKLTKNVVELKSVMEKIREQIQNIE